jgi:hypothetical protein
VSPPSHGAPPASRHRAWPLRPPDQGDTHSAQPPLSTQHGRQCPASSSTQHECPASSRVHPARTMPLTAAPSACAAADASAGGPLAAAARSRRPRCRPHTPLLGHRPRTQLLRDRALPELGSRAPHAAVVGHALLQRGSAPFVADRRLVGRE